LHTGKKMLAGALTAAATGAAVIGISVSSASGGSQGTPGTSVAATAAVASSAPTTTPIKHVVVLFDENVSFDHYFGTYPHAANLPGEPTFTALPNTPSVNGLNDSLLTANPNEDEPNRLSPEQALTCDQNHGYTAEQQAFDGGLMDEFVQRTQGTACNSALQPDDPSGHYGPNGIVMDYYDGNTVTALWNLAQHFTLNDNSYGTQFGPSSPGAINVISGDTHGAVAEGGAANSNVANGTLFGDSEPYFDECSNASLTPAGTLPGSGDVAPGGSTAELTGKNIGDLLNAKGLTWGWFQGGFTPSSYTTVDGQQYPVCGSTHTNIGGASVADYSEHHEPFQYYQSTSNPAHLAPANVDQVGLDTADGGAAGVNNQYDLSWFNQAVTSGDMPAVSYLKAPEYEDGHAGYSDPLDEQRFLVDEINKIEQSPDWSSTAIFIAYDDSDGWYDHQMGPIVRSSNDSTDALNGTGVCGSTTSAAANPSDEDRCGVGPRLPLLVISPWAKQNVVDNTFTDQASIVKFIEQNWSLGQIGNGSADNDAGTLDNAFDFNQAYGHAPAIIMNDATGEVEQTIQPSVPSTTSSSSSTTTTSSTATTTTSSTTTTTGGGWPGGSGGSGGSGGGTPGGHGSTGGSAPTVVCTEKFSGDKVTVTCTTKGGSGKGAVDLRTRVYHGEKLVANKAARVHNHKATFRFSLRKQSHGLIRTLVTVSSEGHVQVIKKSVRR
jgi:phospholipase C